MHVATVAGEFAGYATDVTDGFASYDAHARPLGSFATLAEAKAALLLPELAARPHHLAARSVHRRRTATRSLSEA